MMAQEISTAETLIDINLRMEALNEDQDINGSNDSRTGDIFFICRREGQDFSIDSPWKHRYSVDDSAGSDQSHGRG